MDRRTANFNCFLDIDTHTITHTIFLLPEFPQQFSRQQPTYGGRTHNAIASDDYCVSTDYVYSEVSILLSLFKK